MPDEKTCFVVMGFGEKTDYQTQRTLNLDKTYKGIIKPAVEQCGLKCIRADDIVHAGNIDRPMYEHLLDADLVIADLSTANPNAIYELGVRHALRPYTTIIMVENEFKFPFDLNHQLFRTYEHMGKGIDFEEVMRVRQILVTAINELVHHNPKPDSPVYEYLHIEQPRRGKLAAAAMLEEEEAGTTPVDELAFGALLESAQEAREAEDFVTARALFKKLHEMNTSDAYLAQQWALATYKSPQQGDAGKLAALIEAQQILEDNLEPAVTNDPETLGIWGAIHKRLWDLRKQRSDLDTAVWAYERGYYLKRDYYNGINYAFVLNVRAQQQGDNDEKIADKVLAKRVRKEVLGLVDEAEKKLPRNAKGEPEDAKEAYWVAATRLEALKGLGDTDRLVVESEKLFAIAPEKWMPGTTKDQLAKLEHLL
jgi:hypothetical protein